MRETRDGPAEGRGADERGDGAGWREGAAAAPAARQPSLEERLHSVAIHLLRRVRSEDPASGLSGPRISALSVVVHAGPLTVSELADAEQVSVATTSRMVDALESEGLMERLSDPDDARVRRLVATPKGQRILESARDRRLDALRETLAGLSADDARTLHRAVELLEPLVLPADHPGR